MSQEPFMQTRYPTKVWAAAASAVIFGLSSAASLWLFFGQANPMGLAHADHPTAIHAPLIPWSR